MTSVVVRKPASVWIRLQLAEILATTTVTPENVAVPTAGAAVVRVSLCTFLEIICVYVK